MEKYTASLSSQEHSKTSSLNSDMKQKITTFRINLEKQIMLPICLMKSKHAMRGGASLFDEITKDDLIIAFFPCIYFETLQQTCFDLTSVNYRKKTMCEKIELTLDRLKSRTEFHALLYKLLWIAYNRNLRLIIENPSSGVNYLITGQNFPKPTMIDKNRMLRGDYYIKPTAYWFINCEPTYGRSFQNDKERKTIMKARSSPKAGVCSMERSLISSDYARNFICDFIIGKEQTISERGLFNNI